MICPCGHAGLQVYGSSSKDRSLVPERGDRKDLLAFAGGRASGLFKKDTGLTDDALAALQASLRAKGLESVAALCNSPQRKGGRLYASPQSRGLLFDLGTPAPACQLLPSVAWEAATRLSELPYGSWPPEEVGMLQRWAPRLHSFFMQWSAQAGSQTQNMLGLLRLLRAKAETCFSPSGETACRYPNRRWQPAGLQLCDVASGG